MKFIPNKIQLSVLKRHVGPFVFCFFTIMFLLLMQFLILYIDKLVGKDLPFGIIIELILTNLAYMVVLAAPMAVLVSCLMAFGKFTELNGLTALHAAGVNPIHIITPVLAAASVLSIFLIWFSNDVLPDANQRARTLFLDIRQKKPGFNLEANEFYQGIDGHTILVQNIQSDSLYDIVLFQEPSSFQQRVIIKAEKGYLTSGNEMITFYLNEGTIMRYSRRADEMKQVEVLEETEFERHRLSFDLSEMAFSRSDPDAYSRSDRTMDIEAMSAVIDSLESDIKQDKQELFTDHSFMSDIKKVSEVENKMSAQTFYPDTSNTDSARTSNYVVLSSVSSEIEQNQLHNSTLRNLRNYRSDYTSLEVNVNWQVGRIAEYWVEIHKKISIPLACIIFVLIGAPIGMYSQKGNLGTAALIGTVFLTFFWISLIQGEKLADRLYISPFTGMWFSNILLSAVGSYLLLRLCTSFRITNLWRNRD